MDHRIIFLPILIPVLGTILTALSPAGRRGLKEAFAALATLFTLIAAAMLFGSNFSYTIPWAGFGFDFILRIYNFSGFITLATSFFVFLVASYSTVFMAQRKHAKQFYVYLLLSLAFTNGAVLADNLVLMLFFWEGLLLTLFGMIAVGNPAAFKTATRAFIIVGIADLCMMAGIALSGYISGTLQISAIKMTAAGLGGLAFVFLMIGAISKGGSMPFHSWIPDAAVDAPLPFMAMVPASLEKLLGIYFLTRISIDMFSIDPHSWISTMMMTIGALTILLAVMMALVQKDYKRLLSYHAISQVGYMILGIGTFVPAGIVGGLFHMINNALYKNCLFLTGGAVERQAGTTDLAKLGGLGKNMPVTFACFAIAAVSISGVPPFNGFFSKELVYDGALERGWIFYAAALAGSFLTAASFLKLGHAAFLGKREEANKDIKEAPPVMLAPMIVIAAICVLFGLWNTLPLNLFIQPVLGPERMEGQSFGGLPSNMLLVWLTVIVLAAALLNHLYGVKRTGSGLKAVDHIHYAPVLSQVYDRAEKGFFDPYNIGMVLMNSISYAGWACDKAIDWVYNIFTVKAASVLTTTSRSLQNGNYKTFIIFSMATAVLIIAFMLRSI